MFSFAKHAFKIALNEAHPVVAQLLRLPHDKSRRQGLRILDAIDASQLGPRRIQEAARTLGRDLTEIEQTDRDFGPTQWEADIEGWGRMSMGIEDRRTIYLLVKTLRPNMLIETGTAGGASATYILRAMDENNHGTMHSIDVANSKYLPPDAKCGELIPSELRGRWRLHLQTDSPLLPELLTELGTIDFFLHDSVHEWRHMTWEYELAWAHLGSGACLASHDILLTTAFRTFQKNHKHDIRSVGVVGNTGWIIKA